MPSTAPGAERLAGRVEDDATPVVKPRRAAARAWRWAGVAVFLLVVVVLFDAYLHLSKTYAENSDEANILLMASDMLHGNVILHGWSVSDVPFITTELPQMTLLVWMFGLHLNTAHISAAVTYTLVVAVAMLLAKGRARGWAAVARMALVLGIMLAPQPGVGVFVAILSVGHIGTALPVMLTWLVLDRLGRTWYVPLLVAPLIGWALTADPLVLVVAVLPLLGVCLVRVVSALTAGARAGGLAGMRAAAPDRWFEVWLAAAAGIGYVIAMGAGQLISNHGGFDQQPVPYNFHWSAWFMHARVVVHGLLELFGAYFVPGNAINYLKPGVYLNPAGLPGLGSQGLSGLDQAFALTHLIGVILAVWGACAIARRFFSRDADFVSQLLLAGIVANIAAYVPSTLADATALNVREVAPVLPFAAVLAGRMVGDRLVTGAAIRLPRLRWRPAPGQRLRLLAIPLAALFGWYSYGLFLQADTPAAPAPFARLAAFLEASRLSYGLGGYWESSVITVETGGAVTIRAVTPCILPREWESKADWYDATRHVANFVLIDNVPGFFSQYDASAAALLQLNAWSKPPLNKSKVPVFYQRAFKTKSWPVYADFGGFEPPPDSTIPWYVARVYPGNLLSKLPPLQRALNDPRLCGIGQQQTSSAYTQ